MSAVTREKYRRAWTAVRLLRNPASPTWTRPLSRVADALSIDYLAFLYARAVWMERQVTDPLKLPRQVRTCMRRAPRVLPMKRAA